MRFDHPTTRQIPQLRALWKEAFGDGDAFLDCFFDAAFSPQCCLCAQDGGIVAAAYWFSCGEYAYIYAVATAKSHQGRGICHALMDEIHRELARQDYAGAMVVPGEASLRQFYAGMGYTDFGGIQEFSCEAATPVALRQVSAGEFATLRRQYLPRGGVVQEGENLAFLSRFAQFYAGEDCLVTLSGGNILELLGNRAAAPGILAALGLPSATVRCPGHSPFAMCKPLRGKKCPTYFGFAFD